MTAPVVRTIAILPGSVTSRSGLRNAGIHGPLVLRGILRV
jgi:hypothetical protein